MYEKIVKQYETNGFAVIEKFFSEEEVNLMKKEVDILINKMPEESHRVIFSTSDSESQQNKDRYFLDSGDKISYFYEADTIGPNGELLIQPHLSLNKIGHALHKLDPVFRKMTFSEQVKEVAFQLGYEEPAVVQSMYIFKNPGVGSEVTAHQDATFLYTEPVKVTGFWVALDDATLENGCLWFAAGSHKSGVHRRYIRNPDQDSDQLLIYKSGPPIYQRSNFKPLPVQKGSCIIIHGQVVHFSEANKSELPRHAYTFHIVEQRKCIYSKSNWLQPENAPFMNLYKH